MARRSVPPKPERPILTVEQKLICIERIRKRIKDLEVFDPQTVQKRFPPEVAALENAIDEALTAAFGNGTVEYNRYASAARLDHGPITLVPNFGRGGIPDTGYEARQYLEEGKRASVVLLRQAIRALEEEIGEEKQLAELVIRQPQSKPASNKVFVVHGHDQAAREAMARFLEKIELEAIILHEQPDQGFTIIEKFEAYASQVSFAVVLLTPDDLGGSASAPAQAARARQNVIFELGYFVGKLGRGRACLLRKGEVEIPSDLYGVIYTEMDAAEGWKLKLVKELKAAGLDFDANKVWS
jgi:predicted nucleotide-binding protein